jgi:hypothetical protein
MGQLQLIKQTRHTFVEHSDAIATGGLRKSAGQPCFADATRAGDHQIAPVLNPASCQHLLERDLGRTLIEFSVGRSQDIADIAGCRFVVVDAKTPSVAFYEKCGFRLIDTAENRGRPEPVMFLDLNAF